MTPTQGEHAQPEALRLADALYDGSYLLSVERYTTADELRRLHAQVAALTAAPADADNLRKALQFYADGHHFIKSDGDAWDTVSGEPQNYWCDEAGTATVEDGSIAKLALAGHPIKFEDEDATAQPAAPQGVAYAELPEPVWRTAQCVTFSDRQLYDFADRTHALRASHGQAPAAHVQKPAEIEHVESDVSKNGVESNMAQQPAPSAAGQWTVLNAAGWPVSENISHDAARSMLTSERVELGWRAVPAPTPQADSQPEVDALAALAEAEYLIDNPRAWSSFDQHASDTIAAVCKALRAARAPADSVTVPAGPTDAQIDACARSMLYQPWGIGSRIEDARAFAKRILSKFAPPAQAADSVLEDAALLGQIAEVIRDYHHALDLRKHGGDAARHAVFGIERIVGMRWKQGEEAARRAARKQGDKP